MKKDKCFEISAKLSISLSYSCKMRNKKDLRSGSLPIYIHSNLIGVGVNQCERAIIPCNFMKSSIHHVCISNDLQFELDTIVACSVTSDANKL